MIYTFNLGIVDLLSIVVVVFMLGALFGWKMLPAPIDTKKEELIDRLFKENIAFRLGVHPETYTQPGKEEKPNGSV